MPKYTDLDLLEPIKIQKIFHSKKQFTSLFPYSNHQTEEYLYGTLEAVLKYLKKPNLFNSLQFCLKELAMNGSKANSKRLYFKIKNLDMNNPDEYKKGIETFKSDVFGDFSKYENEHQESGMYVAIRYKLKDQDFIIQVVNNCQMNDTEIERIYDRLKIADQFHTMQEVLSHGFDETEGAGFGIIIIILMLREIGLNERSLVMNYNKELTSFSLKIPLNLISESQGKVISEEIIKEIDEMPQFPESILRLRKEITNPNTDFASVAKIIKTDSSLTAELIRIANSASYRTDKETKDVASAVRKIGLKGVQNFTLKHGVNKLLNDKYDKKKVNQIMSHSFKVASISSFLIKKAKLMKYHDDIFLISMLHDIGKIIAETLQPEMIDKIQHICSKRHIAINVLEDLTDGYNHSIIGSQLAAKWKFPAQLVQGIKFHHNPLRAKELDKAIVFTVHLADEIFYCIEGSRRFSEINFKVLRFFKLKREKVFEEFVNKLKHQLE